MVKTDEAIRVLQLLTVPADFSGLPAFALRMTRLMDRQAVRSDFLSYHLADERVRERIEAAGSQIYIAPSRLRHPLRYIRFVASLVRRERYSIVHCHGNSRTLAIDLLAAKLGGAKVRIAHSHNSTCRFKLLHRLLTPLFNALYTHAFACGVEAGQWLFGDRLYTVVPNAIDTRQFAVLPDVRASARAEFDLGDALVLGHISNYVPAKNPFFLLDVLERTLRRRPDCHLLLVGDGPLRADVEAQAAQRGLGAHVHFAGARTDVPRLLQAMDAFLLPSLYEGFPTVALEAQCAGLPMILSDAVTRDCAMADNMFYQPLDADTWASVLLSIPLVDRVCASRQGIAAVRREGYDLPTAAAQLQSDYIEMAKDVSME